MKKKILFVIAGVLVFSTVLGGTLANTVQSSGAKNVGVQVRNLQMELNGSDVAEAEENVSLAAIPGDKWEFEKNISNVASNGYSFYAKVVIDKKWDREVEKICDQLKVGNTVLTEEVGTESAKTDSLLTDNGWLVTYVDQEQVVMYYTKPVAAGEATTNFLDEISFDAGMGNEFADSSYELEIHAMAVQAGSDKAMVAEFGVYPIFAADGTSIVGISDTPVSE